MLMARKGLLHRLRPRRRAVGPFARCARRPAMRAVLAPGGAGSVTVTESAGRRAGDRRGRDDPAARHDHPDGRRRLRGWRLVLSGIALAVAYSLLRVNRFREERAD